MSPPVDERTSPQHVPANSNSPAPLGVGRSAFPPEAEARIAPCTRMAAGGRRVARKGWRLEFMPRGRRWVEPLMGWTATDDTLAQVELTFPSLEDAIAYAERQGLRYTVDNVEEVDAAAERGFGRGSIERAFADILAAHLATAWLEMRYGIGPATGEVAEQGTVTLLAANTQAESCTGS